MELLLLLTRVFEFCAKKGREEEEYLVKSTPHTPTPTSGQQTKRQNSSSSSRKVADKLNERAKEGIKRMVPSDTTTTTTTTTTTIEAERPFLATQADNLFNGAARIVMAVSRVSARARVARTTNTRWCLTTGANRE